MAQSKIIVNYSDKSVYKIHLYNCLKAMKEVLRILWGKGMDNWSTLEMNIIWMCKEIFFYFIDMMENGMKIEDTGKELINFRMVISNDRLNNIYRYDGHYHHDLKEG